MLSNCYFQATGGSGGGGGGVTGVVGVAGVVGGASGGGGGGGWGVSSSSADSTQATNGEKPTGNLFSDAASEVSRVCTSALVAFITLSVLPLPICLFVSLSLN